jgi:RNA polymerase subunit RPABC4/transcription elongation factor Spt4
MAVAIRRSLTGLCVGCGKLVDGDAVFCPVCGTRQIPDRRTPVTATPGETEQLARSTNAWILAALAATAMLIVAVGMVAGTMSATRTGDVGDDDDADAAETMDAYAPYAETWAEKHGHVADEASGDDPNGLATAAADARLWIGANRAELGALAASADGGSALLYADLVGIFDQRAAVLAEIETTATAGGDGDGAAADEVAALEALDQRADATTCEIADAMRAEGDDPDEHVTPGMDISC